MSGESCSTNENYFNESFDADTQNEIVEHSENPPSIEEIVKHSDLDRSTEEEDDDDVEIQVITTTCDSNAILVNSVPPSSTPSVNVSKPSVVLTPAFNNPLLKPSDFDDTLLTTNYPIFEYDIDKGEKPWRKQGAEISDYFNYGFNQETWKIYCEKQRRLRVETTIVRRTLPEPNFTFTSEGACAAEVQPNPLLPTNDFPSTSQINHPAPNIQIPLPPGINLPPELANTIANLAASSLGLPANFLSQLPNIPNMFSPGMNPQAMFQSFTPNISLPFVVQDNPPNPSTDPQITKKEQLHHDKEVVQPRREHMETSPRHSSRSKDKRDDIRKREIRKHRDKRSRSQDRNYKERKQR